VSAAGEMVERGIVVISLAIASLASGKSQPTGPWLLLASGAGLALLALVLRRQDSVARGLQASEDRIVARVSERLGFDEGTQAATESRIFGDLRISTDSSGSPMGGRKGRRSAVAI